MVCHAVIYRTGRRESYWMVTTQTGFHLPPELLKGHYSVPYFLFCLLMTIQLPDVVAFSKIALYADDSKIYKVEKTQNYGADFQSDLNRICLWSNKWQILY